MTTIHASAVLIGRNAVLIRGASGAGKSSLAWRLIEAERQGLLPFARLVGDDRVELTRVNERLLVRPAQSLAGLLEIRGLGIRKLGYEPVAQVGVLADLGAAGTERLPDTQARAVTLESITLPRLTAVSAEAALPIILAFLRTETVGD